MDKLRALPIVDITGINRQINKLIAAVDELPLAYQQRAADEKLLMEPLAIRLGGQTTLAKPLVMAGHPTEKLHSKLIMQVHDELVLEVPQAELHLVKEMLPKLMCGVAELKVPLLVELGEGKNWDEAH